MTTANTLNQIADDYWIIRNGENVIGVIVRHDDRYTGFLDGKAPEVLASIEAVADYANATTR